MKISRFFNLLFITLFSVLTMAGLVIYLQVYDLRSNIEKIVNKKEPFEKTVLEMETIASSISNAVLGYIQNNQLRYRNQIQLYKAKFDKYLKDYQKYAETKQEIRLGKRLDTIYNKFMQVADSIVTISNLQQNLLEEMKEQAIIMKEVPEYQLSQIVNNITPASLRKTQMLLKIRSINEDMLLAMGNYIVSKDVRSVVKIVESERNYPPIRKAFWEQFPADTTWFKVVDKSYNELVRIGNRIIGVEDDKRRLIVNFKTELTALETLLNKDIQPLIVEANRGLLASSKGTAFFTVNFLTLVGIVLIIIFAFVQKTIQKLIISPVLELYKGTQNLEKGRFRPTDLTHSLSTRNEIGDLAHAFLNMANNLKKSFEEIQNLWKEQIALTEQLAFNNRELEKTQSDLLISKMDLETKVEIRTAELREERNRLTASINYAKRIQEAMLPLREKMLAILNEHLLIYKPRDIVSGDFYWLGEKQGRIIVAAVDCTGHGVPGAFMSMIGNELINEIVQMRQVVRADLILNELHKAVRKVLQQEETHNNDGMDVALVSINKAQGIIEFAGAKNPLVAIRIKYTSPNTEEHNALLQKDTTLKHIQAIDEQTLCLVEATIIKGDITPIGGMQKEQERLFTLHTIALNKSQQEKLKLYLFSDGYQDQFGGEKGKKFTANRFYEAILQSAHLPFEEQQQYLEYTHKNWMQDRKQLDDILIIGFEV